MCREWKGYGDAKSINGVEKTDCNGVRPNAAAVPYRLASGGEATFTFEVPADRGNRPARLRVHTADQSPMAPTLKVTINGRKMIEPLPKGGLGVQERDPSHLAFPATAVFELAPTDLRVGMNTLTIHVPDQGRFSWDALDLVVR
jgi:hypothetical protein